jgi:hypothetical protein
MYNLQLFNVLFKKITDQKITMPGAIRTGEGQLFQN